MVSCNCSTNWTIIISFCEGQGQVCALCAIRLDVHKCPVMIGTHVCLVVCVSQCWIHHCNARIRRTYNSKLRVSGKCKVPNRTESMNTTLSLPHVKRFYQIGPPAFFLLWKLVWQMQSKSAPMQSCLKYHYFCHLLNLYFLQHKAVQQRQTELRLAREDTGQILVRWLLVLHCKWSHIRQGTSRLEKSPHEHRLRKVLIEMTWEYPLYWCASSFRLCRSKKNLWFDSWSIWFPSLEDQIWEAYHLKILTGKQMNLWILPLNMSRNCNCTQFAPFRNKSMQDCLVHELDFQI